jgi:hypothetical protein
MTPFDSIQSFRLRVMERAKRVGVPSRSTSAWLALRASSVKRGRMFRKSPSASFVAVWSRGVSKPVPVSSIGGLGLVLGRDHGHGERIDGVPGGLVDAAVHDDGAGEARQGHLLLGPCRAREEREQHEGVRHPRRLHGIEVSHLVHQQEVTRAATAAPTPRPPSRPPVRSPG